MKVTWEVDEATTVEAHYKAFGKEIVRVNGQEVLNRRSLSYKARTEIPLDASRKAVISARARALAAPEVVLHVGGEQYAPRGSQLDRCPACGAGVRTFDRFCDGCGKPLPTAEMRQHEKQVRDATNALFWLGGMFAFFGCLIAFVAPRDGGFGEAIDVLITNGLLAVTMIALGFWGRRAPLPAILVASAVYAMVHVTNAIIDPKTIAQGIILKIIVIGLLVRGIKAALALRAVKAATPAAP